MSKGSSTATSEQDLDRLTTLFRLLSDKTRLNIVMRLSQGECNVSSLCDHLDMPQPTVSHHLSLLRLNNVIGNRRKGKQIFYTLNRNVDVPGATALRIGTEKCNVELSAKAS